MATVEARLANLAGTLTAREYIIVKSGLWDRDHEAEADWRVEHLLPLDERAEFHRIVGVLQKFMERVQVVVPLWECMVIDVDRRIAWAESLNAWEAHCASLRRELKRAKAKSLATEVGLCNHGVRFPLGSQDTRTSWRVEDLPALLLENVASDVVECFQDLEAIRVVIDELSLAELGGSPVLSKRSAASIARHEQLLCDSIPRLAALGIVVERHPATPEQIAKMREHLDREPPPGSEASAPRMLSRAGLSLERRAELDALEEWLASTWKQTK